VGLAEAKKWVSAEYRKEVGDWQVNHSVANLVDSAADLLTHLGRAGEITLAHNRLDAASLAQSLADWVVTQLQTGGYGMSGKGTNDLRLVTLTRIHADSLLMTNANPSSAERVALSAEAQLSGLADQSYAYVAALREQKHLRFSDKDTAMAWLIQRVQEEEVEVSRDQVGRAISLAFERNQSH
jgi:hypothetical protein